MHRKVYYGCFGTDAPVVYFNFTAFAQNSNVMGNQRALGSLMKSNNWKLLLFSLHSTDLKLRKSFFTIMVMLMYINAQHEVTMDV